MVSSRMRIDRELSELLENDRSFQKWTENGLKTGTAGEFILPSNVLLFWAAIFLLPSD